MSHFIPVEGALSVRTAVLISGFAEWLGATVLGHGVSKTIQKGVASTDDPHCWACGYCDSGMAVYAVGMLSALIAAALFLLAVTARRMPVSTTHTVVGAVVGMTIVGKHNMDGFSCLNWSFGLRNPGLSSMVVSWVISPILSGCVAVAIYAATHALTFRTAQPTRNALLLLPFLYSLTSFVVCLLILLKSQPTKSFSMRVQLFAAVGISLLMHLLATVCGAPQVRRRIAAAPHAEPTKAEADLADCTSAFSKRGRLAFLWRPRRCRPTPTPQLHVSSLAIDYGATSQAPSNAQFSLPPPSPLSFETKKPSFSVMATSCGDTLLDAWARLTQLGDVEELGEEHVRQVLK